MIRSTPPGADRDERGSPGCPELELERETGVLRLRRALRRPRSPRALRCPPSRPRPCRGAALFRPSSSRSSTSTETRCASSSIVCRRSLRDLRALVLAQRPGIRADQRERRAEVVRDLRERRTARPLERSGAASPAGRAARRPRRARRVRAHPCAPRAHLDRAARRPGRDARADGGVAARRVRAPARRVRARRARSGSAPLPRSRGGVAGRTPAGGSQPRPRRRGRSLRRTDGERGLVLAEDTWPSTHGCEARARPAANPASTCRPGSATASSTPSTRGSGP